MAGSKPPSWKQVFDAAERTIGTRINEFARSENAAILMGLATRASRELSTRTERVSRQVLHLANLPAGSDVNRLLAQIGKLEREVRALRNQFDDIESFEQLDAAVPSPPVRLATRSAASVAKAPASATRSAGSGKRKVAPNGVVRQSSKRARQDPA
ncbi:MAG: hypothetical protein ABIR68_01685 [Ilumatobacteraceae bacterium]